MAQLPPAKTSASGSGIEVQIMDDMSCVLGDDPGPNSNPNSKNAGHAPNSIKDTIVEQLLGRVRLLEAQITTCLMGQPLLHQVLDKCNGLEQRLDAFENATDKRFKEITMRGVPPSTGRSSHSEPATALLPQPPQQPEKETDSTSAPIEKIALVRPPSPTMPLLMNEVYQQEQPEEISATLEPVGSVTTPSIVGAPRTRAKTRTTSSRVCKRSSTATAAIATPSRPASRPRPRARVWKPQCPECGVNSRDAFTLKTHIAQVHRGQGRVPCSECGKAILKSNMKFHMMVHTGERPLACPHPHCDKRFRVQTNLKNHLSSIHTGHKPYGCDKCGSKYACRGDLKKHKVKKHT